MAADQQDPWQAAADLVHKATSKRQGRVAAEHLAGIKALCKASDSNVEAIFDALYERLKRPNSQVRLLALEVCDELFGRSKRFRTLLCARLTHALELVVGFKPSNPLPPPVDAATALRARALEALERWHALFGTKYQQLALGYSYLKNTLRCEFPNRHQPPAQIAAERREREAAARRAAEERFAMLREEHAARAAEFQSFLDQMAECFEVLAQQQRQQQQQQHGADGDEDLEWEDVEGEPAATRPGALLEGGLPGYAADPPQHGAAAASVGAASSSPATAAAAAGPGVDARAVAAAAAAEGNEAVLETLAGLHRLVATQAVPAVEEWLQVLGQVGAQHEQRGQLLAASTTLKDRLLAAQERYEGLQRALAARAAAREAEAKARAVVALDDLFGPASDAEDEPQQQAEGEQQQQQHQQTEQPLARERAGQAEQAEQPQAQPPQLPPQQQQQQQGDSREKNDTEEAAAHNPYESFVDPAAPKQRLAAPRPKAVPRPAAAAAAAQRPGSDLPENLRKALADKAPVLPGGLYTHYWDTNGAPVYVSGHGLEVSNHWGPVDVHTELPPERVEELFLHAYTVPPQSQQQQAQQAAAGQGPPAAAAEQPRSGSAAGGQRAARSGGGASSSGYRSGASSEGGASSSRRASAAARRAVGGAGTLGLLGALEDEDREAKRARRAAERAYNDAVIGGVLGGEELARQLHEAELARLEGRGEEGGGGGGAGRQKRQKPKPSVRERLEKKLLKGRGAAARDAAAAAEERHRDQFGGRWENK